MKANNIILAEVNAEVQTPEWEVLNADNKEFSLTGEGNEIMENGRTYEEYTRISDGAVFRKYFPNWLRSGSVSYQA